MTEKLPGEMSDTAEECVERMAEASKALKESLKGFDFKKMFRNMYGLKEENNGST